MAMHDMNHMICVQFFPLPLATSAGLLLTSPAARGSINCERKIVTCACNKSSRLTGGGGLQIDQLPALPEKTPLWSLLNCNILSPGLIMVGFETFWIMRFGIAFGTRAC